MSDRANGWVQYEGYWAGGDEERVDGEDGLQYTRSRTVRCLTCGARSPRPTEDNPRTAGFKWNPGSKHS